MLGGSVRRRNCDDAFKIRLNYLISFRTPTVTDPLNIAAPLAGPRYGRSPPAASPRKQQPMPATRLRPPRHARSLPGMRGGSGEQPSQQRYSRPVCDVAKCFKVMGAAIGWFASALFRRGLRRRWKRQPDANDSTRFHVARLCRNSVTKLVDFFLRLQFAENPHLGMRRSRRG